jgi:hypothetical protein
VTAATATDLILVAPLAFAFGVLVGLALSSRYRIIRRNGDRPC